MGDFDKDERNPLGEMSDLRLELDECEDDFDIKCLLRFGTGEFSYKGKPYVLGFLRAQLQLGLEGLETVLGSDFSEATITHVNEVDSVLTGSSGGAAADAEFDTDGQARTRFVISAKARREHNREAKQEKTKLPISTLPGNRWQVEMPANDGALEGTVMSGERLTRLRRKTGVNRVGVVAEVHVKKREICVTPPSGNALTKALRLTKNRDEVVGLVLQKAMRREAADVTQHHPEVVVVSKTTFSEPE